jgi:very-short-patch-repair endonuclease
MRLTKDEYTEHLRAKATEAEKLLWAKLEPFGCFDFQLPICGYFPDFRHLPSKLAIEVDGNIHNTPGKREDDLVKYCVLQENGYDVLVFTNDQVLGDVEGVVEDILKEVAFADVRDSIASRMGRFLDHCAADGDAETSRCLEC